MDCSLPGSSIHGIFQARVLEWGAIAFSVAYAHSTLIHNPGSLLSLRLWLQVEQELDMKNCCHFVDIFCNYNLPTSSYQHL